MTRLRYRDDMTADETRALVAACAADDAVYAAVEAIDASVPPGDPEDEAAAGEQSGAYFDRYIAGDR